MPEVTMPDEHNNNLDKQKGNHKVFRPFRTLISPNCSRRNHAKHRSKSRKKSRKKKKKEKCLKLLCQMNITITLINKKEIIRCFVLSEP